MQSQTSRPSRKSLLKKKRWKLPYILGVLGQRFFFSVLLVSTLLTLIFTSLKVYFDYQRDINQLNKVLQEIKTSHIKAFGRSLWNVDNSQLQLQLQGIVEIPDIQYVEILSTRNQKYKSGSLKGHSFTKEMIYDITYDNHGNNVHLGKLKIISTHENIYKNIRNKFFPVLITQALKIFSIAFCFLYLFHYLIGQHLNRMAKFTHDISLETLDQNLTIKKYRDPNFTDEIDQIVDAINKMNHDLKRELRENINVENQLRQSQKMEALGTFAGGIAHDFNNILQGLMHALSLIEEDAGDNHGLRNKINISSSLCERGKELVKQILLYGRPDEGRGEVFPITPVISDVMDIMRSIGPKNLDIHLSAGSQDHYIYGNPTQIRQVILNLGTNAIQALRPNFKGQIKVEISRQVFNQYSKPLAMAPGNYAIISIKDNGSGIAESLHEKIFEPFFTTKEVGKGTGLGLSIVHSIIKTHKGYILLQSREEEGTSFTIYIPLVDQDSEKQKITRYRGNEKILLVDDDPDFLEILEDMILSLGHKAIICQRPKEALKIIKNPQQNIELLITDLIMPKMNGIELAKKVQSLKKDFPIILLTGFYDKEAHPPEDLKINIMEKPPSTDFLARIIRKTIEKAYS